jgi:hypothetical protein
VLNTTKESQELPLEQEAQGGGDNDD